MDIEEMARRWAAGEEMTKLAAEVDISYQNLHDKIMRYIEKELISATKEAGSNE